ncbi:MAG: hypothetical protein DI573_01035 [Microbacterium sp.]|uniref:winged helix-turn-helix domain-containing protein n=1 Tax=unclassified Microbacterium TaxID=2609290 RepID=UPI000DB1F5C5|nr:crosslink repair DNA glycosylase YcaQ family protein [Microbacterium sp.]PZU41461.1 MAG: hypothetical protein DI573_01035 [Microbacterium sp.]
MRQTLSAAQARRAALAAQGFGARPGGSAAGDPGTRRMNAELRRMRVLQIDSVNVFARSHYMPLFSRLGPYDTGRLDRLLFARRAPYVEFWAHVASFIPAEDWGLFAFRMDDHRARYAGPATWFAENTATVEWVRAELASRGPLRPAEIESDAHAAARGPWWDWNEVKRALEYLWLFGEVAIAGRRGFERRYALAHDVIPAHVQPVARDEAMRELVRRAAAAYGVATESDLDDYWRLRRRGEVRRAIAELVEAGELLPVAVEGWERGGRALPAWMHRDAVVPRRVEAATVLTPFDPMVWFRERAERLFAFDYRIEIYTPSAQRRFGYYSLPVLVGDDVVGRVDLKADRTRSRLLVQSAWWEPGAPPHAAESLAGVLRDAATWQGLESVSISGWGDAVDDLARVMSDAARHDRVDPQPVEPAADEPAAAQVIV